MLLHTEELAANPARGIRDGDLVVVYEGFESMKQVRVAAGSFYDNRYGQFAHSVSAVQWHACARGKEPPPPPPPPPAAAL